MFAELSPLLAAGNTGELFRQILPYSFVAVVVIVAIHLVVALVYRGGPRERKRWNWWDVLIYLGTLGAIGVLAGTSFYEVWRHGALLGWPLFLHMVGAGAFTAALPLLALSWAHWNQFRIGPEAGKAGPPKFFWLQKCTFWTILIAGFVVTMTMLLSMLTLFGTDGMLLLLDLHRYSGLVVVLAAVIHLYAVAMQRFNLR